MNRIFRLPLLAVVALAVAACGDDAEMKRRIELRAQIETAHDEAMAIQSQIRQLRDVITVRLDSLSASKDTLVTKPQIVDLAHAQGLLGAATEDMDRWMEAYNADSAGMETPAGTAYLMGQQAAVDALHKGMTTTLTNSMAVAQRYNLPIPAAAAKADSTGHGQHSH